MSNDPRVELGAAILAASGMNPSSLKGPLFPRFYDPIEAQEEFERRKMQLRESDKRFCKAIIEAACKERPWDILAVFPTRIMADAVLPEIARLSGAKRIQQYRFQTQGGGELYVITDNQGRYGARGRRVDEVILHDDISWRTYVAVIPSKQPRY